MENKINFQVFSNEEYDKRMNEILSISSDWSVEKISKYISEKMSLTFIPAQPLEQNVISSFPFYRIRVWNENDKPIDEKNPLEYSYIQDKNSVKMGRANREGIQVLYGAGDPHTPFHELKKQIKLNESIVYLTKWGIKPEAKNVIMRNMFFGIPFENREDYASIMAKAIQEGIDNHLRSWPQKVKEDFLYGQKKYNELYCSEGEHYYHITSSMLDDHFNPDAKNKLPVPIVTYPSVAMKRTSVNFAINKEFVDDFMYIKEVKKIVVKEYKDDSIEMTLLGRGLFADGKIAWQSIKAKLESIDFDHAKVIFNGNEKLLIDLKPEDRITTCCKNHAMTLEEFFKKSNQTPETVMNGFTNTNLGSFEGEFPLKVQRAIVAPTFGNVYLSNDIRDEKRVSHFIVPFTYTLNYQEA